MFNYSKDGINVASMLDKRKLNSKGEYPVKIRVNHMRKRVYYSTGISMSKEDWEKLPQNKSNSGKITRESIESSFSLVKGNVEALAEKGDFSFDLLNSRLGRAIGGSVNDALRAKISMLESEGRIGSMELHCQTLMNVEKFDGVNISFNSITVQWLKKCEQFWLKTKNQTTVGMHFRNIRAIMNEAKKSGIIKESQYPFGKDKFEIKTGEATKKALTAKNISDIYRFDDGNDTTARYRDLWLFIFLCNGINVVDMVKLKFSDIVDGEICFVRQKTERTTKSMKRIKVVVTPQLQAIINRWGNMKRNDNYIFPYLTGNEDAIQRKNITKDLTKRINKRMQQIGKTLEIGNITTYVARHSFATILKRGGANIAYISESLGHSDLKTTESYLASFEKDERIKNADILLSAFNLEKCDEKIG